MPIDFALLWGLIPFEADPAAPSAPFSHDRALVGVSMLVAVAAAYACLELAGRGRVHLRWSRASWMAAAGAMLGAGIWATHFIGMLAFQSPLKHGFAFLPTTISALVVIGLGCAAFTLAGLRPTWRSLLIAGACVGLGAILMHFLGMRGLRIEAALSYRPIPVAATSLGAVVAGVAALRLAHRTSPSWLRGVAAFPMGAVIAGLHYTDAAATIITPRPAFAPPPQTDAAPMMATLVIAAMVFLSAVALLAAALDRGAARRAARGDASAVSTAPTAGADVIVIPNPSRQADADTIILAPDRNGRRPQDDVRSS